MTGDRSTLHEARPFKKRTRQTSVKTTVRCIQGLVRQKTETGLAETITIETIAPVVNKQKLTRL